MDFNPTVPIWLQVATELQREMATGARPPGSKMPGGRDLALQYSINPNTAARVYQELERGGLCVTRRGMGTFVTEDTARIRELREEMAAEAVREFRQRIRGLGFTRDEAIRMLEKEERENAQE